MIVTEATLVFIALTGIFALSFYAVLVAGQLSLGQAGFAALAAFISVRLMPDPERIGELPTLLIALGIGVTVGAVAALLVGLPTMHLRGVFLAIATLGVAEGVRVLLINAGWSGGASGLSVPKILPPWFAWLVLAVIVYCFWRQGPSRYGRALAAIREDELAARAMGIDVGRHRLSAFVTAGAIAGCYGVLWASYVRLIVPEDFSFSTAIDGLVTAVVGGSTVVIGPLLGSVFLTLIPELQRAVGLEAGWIRPFLAGAMLLAVILFLPGGLASLIPRRRTAVPAGLTDGGVDDDPGSELDGSGHDGADHDGAASGRADAVESVVPLRAHPAAGDPVIDLQAVGKQYGGVRAVRDVDLTIAAAEVVGLIGPNGAGKTTLVNMISGMALASTGTLRVLGVDPGRMPVHRVAAAGVSRTFQHSKLFGRLTALENVLVGAHLVTRPTWLRRMLWLPSARREERRATRHAARCLARVGLAGRAGTASADLSYGDQRRLEIARALASDPSLLILDEPAAGMNRVEAEALSELIGSLAAGGLTVLLIEHNVGMVMRTCDRIVVLDFGEVIATGTPAEIRDNTAVIDAYLGSSEVI